AVPSRVARQPLPRRTVAHRGVHEHGVSAPARGDLRGVDPDRVRVGDGGPVVLALARRPLAAGRPLGCGPQRAGGIGITRGFRGELHRVNPAERTVRAVDGLQQRHAWIAFVFAIVKKYGDDRGPQLAVLLTYYGFMSLFPLLLIFTTILGFIGNEHIEHSVVGTTLAQFPVFGQQIGKDAAHPLTGSGVGLAIGLVLLFYGTLGLAQAAQHAMAQLWNVPGVVRPGFFPRLARSLMFFSVLAAGMVVSTAANAVVTGHGHNVAIRIVALAITAVI